MKIITIEEHIAFKNLSLETEKHVDDDLTTRKLNTEFDDKYY